MTPTAQRKLRDALMGTKLDLTPRTVLASVKGKRPTKVRVVPLSNQADPFQADSGHLPRFRRMVDTPEVAGCDYGPASNHARFTSEAE